MDVLIKPDNFEQYGIEATDETKKLIIGKEKIVLPVFRIPIKLLKYNQRNGRIYSQIFNLKNKDMVDLDSYDTERYNEEIETLIWERDPDKNEATKLSIHEYDQLEPGVVLVDGTVIDGNRRFTCIRRLNRDTLEGERFEYFNAAILDKDDSKIAISEKDIRRYELTVQFGQEEKVDYNVLNKALSIYNDIANNNFTVEEMAEIMGKTKNQIMTQVETIKLVHDYLSFIKSENDYEVADKLNVYYVLEPFAQYLQKLKKKNTPSKDINEKKQIFYSYLTAVRFDLPTQTLRNKLIQKIFGEPDYYDTFKTEFFDKHYQTLDEKLESNGDISSDDRLRTIKDLRNSETSQSMKKLFYQAAEKVEMERSSDVPAETLKGVLTSLEELNLTPIIRARAEDKLTEVKAILEQIQTKVVRFQNDIESKDDDE